MLEHTCAPGTLHTPIKTTFSLPVIWGWKLPVRYCITGFFVSLFGFFCGWRESWLYHTV